MNPKKWSNLTIRNGGGGQHIWYITRNIYENKAWTDRQTFRIYEQFSTMLESAKKDLKGIIIKTTLSFIHMLKIKHGVHLMGEKFF